MAANVLNCRDCCHLVCDADHIHYMCINRFQSYVYVPPDCLFRCTPPNTRVSGRSRVHTPNYTSIGVGVFVGFAVVTNRQTLKPRCIGSNRPQL